jgi:hypothetical protein
MIKKHPYRTAVKHIRELHHAERLGTHAPITCAVCHIPYPCKTIQLIDDDLYDDSEVINVPSKENLFEELL